MTRHGTEGAVRAAVRAAQARLSFALYLTALALLPWKWLSPLGGLSDRAGWTDVFVAAAAVAWALEMLRRGERPRLRAPHWALAAYLALGLLSALIAAADRTAALTNVLLMAELAVLFVLTSYYAAQPGGRSAIALVVLLVSVVTILQALLAVGLFYLHVHTSLVGAYGGDLQPSDSYARIAAGFYSAPLLGSFCIFASAVLAWDDLGVPRWLLRATRLGLAVVVVLTISRAILAFALAAFIRFAHRRGWRRARLATAAATIATIAVVATLSVGHLRVNPARPDSASYVVGGPADSPRLGDLESSSTTFAHNPVLGVGPGVMPGRSLKEKRRAHLTVVNVAATVGAPALLALLVFIGAIWRERRRPTDWAVWSGLIGLGVDGLGQDVDHFRHVWLLLGLADAERRDPDP